jgi:hypothetical protein
MLKAVCFPACVYMSGGRRFFRGAGVRAKVVDGNTCHAVELWRYAHDGEKWL